MRLHVRTVLLITASLTLMAADTPKPLAVERAQAQYQTAKTEYRLALERAIAIAGDDGDATKVEALRRDLISLGDEPTTAEDAEWRPARGQRYALVKVSVSWHQAEQIAEALGGHLVTFSDPREQQYVMNMARGAYAWVGATDEGSEGQWRWIDGTKWHGVNWARGEPNNGSSGRENFAAINHKDYVGVVDTVVSEPKIAAFIIEWDPAPATP